MHAFLEVNCFFYLLSPLSHQPVALETRLFCFDDGGKVKQVHISFFLLKMSRWAKVLFPLKFYYSWDRLNAFT